MSENKVGMLECQVCGDKACDHIAELVQNLEEHIEALEAVNVKLQEQFDRACRVACSGGSR